MCGRYSLFEIEKFLSKYGVEIKPIFNIAPSMKVPIITKDGVKFAKWGYVPGFAKIDKFKTINTRSETISEVSMFKKSFEEKRCLIPADGFYEWKTTPNKKIPFRIQFKNNELFCFAGIWETRDDYKTFSIITTTTNQLIKPVHDRMPVILTKENEQAWLDAPIKEVLKPFESDNLEMFQVTEKVNSSSFNDPEVLKKIATLDSY